jgi:hypothetical protein
MSVRQPARLRRWAIAGATLMALGIALSSTAAIRQGLWDFTSLPHSETHFRCVAQLQYRVLNEEAIGRQIHESEDRLAVLSAALNQPANPHFAAARAAIAQENAELSTLRGRAIGFGVQPLRYALAGVLAALACSVALSLGAGRLMLWHGTTVFGADALEAWTRPYSGWSLLFAGTLILREVLTSVLTIKKTWFGWGSFCVSTPAWSLNLLLMVGLSMVVAYPLLSYGASAAAPTARKN